MTSHTDNSSEKAPASDACLEQELDQLSLAGVELPIRKATQIEAALDEPITGFEVEEAADIKRTLKGRRGTLRRASRSLSRCLGCTGRRNPTMTSLDKD